MTVDIYGKCGPLKCDMSADKTHGDPCKKLLANYKFYLSFENSLWEDYVTEKLFNAMTNFIIPIVYGGANYSRFIPPKSYINANDFVSVATLANYLSFLDDNPSEYIKYFWWRKYYKIVRQSEMTKFCELCVKLYSANQTKPKVYHDIEKWWFRKAKKMKPLI